MEIVPGPREHDSYSSASFERCGLQQWTWRSIARTFCSENVWHSWHADLWNKLHSVESHLAEADKQLQFQTGLPRNYCQRWSGSGSRVQSHQAQAAAGEGAFPGRSRRVSARGQTPEGGRPAARMYRMWEGVPSRRVQCSPVEESHEAPLPCGRPDERQPHRSLADAQVVERLAVRDVHVGRAGRAVSKRSERAVPVC